jgi:hypothetical protein
MDGSGSSKSLRGVGLIQVFQNLDLTALKPTTHGKEIHTHSRIKSQPYNTSRSRSNSQKRMGSMGSSIHAHTGSQEDI